MSKNEHLTETQHRLRLAESIKSKLLDYPIDLEFQRRVEQLLETSYEDEEKGNE